MDDTTKAAFPDKVLLLTRPAALSHAFLAKIESRAGQPLAHLVAPLFEIRPTGARIPAKGALILTSGRAVEALPARALAGRRAYCVGERTAALAQAEGADAVMVGADAAALVSRIVAEQPGPLTYLRGEHSALDLATRLRTEGIEITEIRVYESRDRPFGPEPRRLLASDAAILAPVFSPRSAALLAQAAGDALARMTIAAISAAAAAPLQNARSVGVAAHPDADAMASVVLSLWADLP